MDQIRELTFINIVRRMSEIHGDKNLPTFPR